MRKLKILVYPGLRIRGQLGREFARGEHYLMEAIRQMVSIDIHVIKVVVKPNCLGLLISLKQWPRVPESDVLDRILIPCDHVGSQIGESADKRFPGYRPIYMPCA